MDLDDHWVKQEVEENSAEWNILIYERIHAREQKKWWKTVNERPKLRTYIQIKKKLVFADYLQSEDRDGRRLLAKLRSGTNFLRIETGRREDALH